VVRIRRHASAERDQRRRNPIGQARKQQGQAEQPEQRDGGVAPELVGAHRPAAADRRQRGDEGEGRRHAEQERQAPSQERLIGARKDER
jgi:hypothetical protein